MGSFRMRNTQSANEAATIAASAPVRTRELRSRFDKTNNAKNTTGQTR
jgi:hypothetical protein